MQIATLTALLAAITLTTADPTLHSNSASPRAPPPVNSAHERRGVAFNNPNFVRYFAVEGTHATWCYNWDSITSSYDAWFNYVPMLYSLREEHTDPWLGRVEQNAKRNEDSTWVLGFNEPDLCEFGSGGTCISVRDAVAGWKKWMDPLQEVKKKMYLGSPAVSNVEGQENMGLNWLVQFIDACSGCQIDFINIHWYGEAGEHQKFKDHVVKARRIAAGRPIWVTELKARGNDRDIMTFLDLVIPWMDKSSDIHRYAYFMARPGPGLLINEEQTNLSDIGAHYNFLHWVEDVQIG